MKILKNFLLIITLLSISACNANNIKQCDDTVRIVNYDSYEIIFDFDNVNSIAYVQDSDYIYVQYNDPDVFDLDHLAFETGRDKWYGDYVSIYVNDTISFDFLYDYQNWKYTTTYISGMDISSRYKILEEDITFEDGTKDIIFSIQINND